MKRKTNRQPKTTIRDNCPEDRIISAFIEGKLSGREKEGVFSHLHHCRDCYQLVVESVELGRGLDETIPVSKSPSFYHRIVFFLDRVGRKRTAGLAIPLIAAFMFFLYFSGEPEWSSGKLLAGIKPGPDTALSSSVLSRIKKDRTILGFSSGSTDQQLAFKIGIMVVDIKLCRMLADEDGYNDASKKLNSLIAKNEKLLSSLPLQGKKSEEILPFAIVDKVEEHYLESDMDYFFKLGLFVESASLLSLSKRSDFINRSNLDVLTNHAEFQDLPPGIIRRLVEIEKNLEKNTVEKTHEIIYTLTLEIRQILS